MEHPFALQTQLSLEQASTVSGAGNCEAHSRHSPNCLVAALPEDYKRVIRPPMASTQAIGEEGGTISE